MSSTEFSVEIDHVSKHFGSFVAVDDVSLTVRRGEFFSLLGPSGCGKTTLLRMIAGFDLPDGGQILLNGADIASLPPEARPVRTVAKSSLAASTALPIFSLASARTSVITATPLCQPSV